MKHLLITSILGLDNLALSTELIMYLQAILQSFRVDISRVSPSSERNFTTRLIFNLKSQDQSKNGRKSEGKTTCLCFVFTQSAMVKNEFFQSHRWEERFNARNKCTSSLLYLKQQLQECQKIKLICRECERNPPD